MKQRPVRNIVQHQNVRAEIDEKERDMAETNIEPILRKVPDRECRAGQKYAEFHHAGKEIDVAYVFDEDRCEFLHKTPVFPAGGDGVAADKLGRNVFCHAQ